MLARHYVDAEGVTETLGGEDADATFPIASITKTVVALAAARLAVRDEVSWDAPALSSGGSPISLRQLLLHTAGLPFEYSSRQWSGPSVTRDELLSAFDDPPRIDLPRGTWHYSNLGYALAGIALERATGRPLSELVGSLVLDPLGMHATSFPRQPGPLGAGAAAGGLWSSLADLATLGAALGGDRPDVVGQDELAQLLRSGTSLPDGTVWGAGIRTVPVGPHRILFASGTISDRTTGLVVWPRRGVSVLLAQRGLPHETLRDAGIERWRRPDELHTWWWDGQEVVEARHGASVDLVLRETGWPIPVFSGVESAGRLRGRDHTGMPRTLVRSDARLAGPGIHLVAAVEDSAYGAGA